MRKLLILLSLVWAWSCTGSRTFDAIVIEKDYEALPVADEGVRVFSRITADKAGRALVTEEASDGALKIVLRQDPSLPAESYKIGGSTRRRVTITGADGNGLLYGLGAYLHSAEVNEKGFTPGACDGFSSPEKQIRGMYFATHYENYYHTAPLPDVEEYMEDLAMWGCNSICVWLDLNQYSGMNDPKAESMVQRLAAIVRKGRVLGMSACLATNANEGFNTTPVRLRAVPPVKTGLGMNPTDICPSVPGGTALILKNRRACFDSFIRAGLVPDYFWIFPYDEGGCECDACMQWGTNGFVRITRDIVAMVKEMMPDTKSILSTWGFDCFKGRFVDKGEYAGLAEIINRDGPWTDYLLADNHREYPRWFLENGTPAGLPLLNFPEISMHGNRPWGGYGANPQMERLDSIYHEASPVIVGGWPYSEGVYEDLNKILYQGFYWNDSLRGKDIARKYVEFYFSRKLADRIMHVLDILEKNYGCKFNTRLWKPGEEVRVKVPDCDYGADEIWKEVQEVDALLPERVARSWRWRLIYVRSYFDQALRHSDGRITDEMLPYMKENCEISGSQVPESWKGYLDYIHYR